MKLKKYALKELVFAKFEFFAFIKFDFIKFVKFDIFNLIDFVTIDKCSIFLLISPRLILLTLYKTL